MNFNNSLQPVEQKNEEKKSFWLGTSPHQQMVNEMLKEGIDIPYANSYYRYYNDGDYPSGVLNKDARSLYNGFKNLPRSSQAYKEESSKFEDMLEARLAEIVQATYNKYKGIK